MFLATYKLCHRCGALHDDGTPELCMDCLDYLDEHVADDEDLAIVSKLYRDFRPHDPVEADRFEREELSGIMVYCK